MKKLAVMLIAPLLLWSTLVAAQDQAATPPAQEQTSPSDDGWRNLFDGSTLEGWEISSTNHHGNTQDWKVVDGAIEGTQDKSGNGGVLLSKDTFRDFIVEAEINPDWGLDSGFFVRSDPAGKCYQIRVDYYENGNVGGIYGEAIGGFGGPYNGNWKEIYKAGEWNRLVVVCTGNPPRIDVWLNGYHVVEYKDEGPVKLDAEGHIALQVHAGEKFFGLKTRFRNIRIRELNLEETK